MRTCAKMRCGHEPVVTVSLSYGERQVVIEDLFDRVPVGTKVLVVGSRPANAGYWDTPAAADI